MLARLPASLCMIPAAQHAGVLSTMLMQARHVSTSVTAADGHLQLIKQLRERTGSPISEVKSCLEASGWDVEAAYEALRKKGLAAAAKKASRHATEGLIGCSVHASRSEAVLVEVNCETDFVARSQIFQDMVGQVAAAALRMSPSPTNAADTQGMAGIQELPVEQILQTPVPAGVAAADAVAAVAAQVRENVKLRRAWRCSTPTGVVCTFQHQRPAPGLGRIAAMLAIQPEGGATLTEEQKAQMREVGNQLAMQVVGLSPRYLTRAHVPQHEVAKERALLTEQASGSGKPAQVVTKVVDGRLSKWYEDVALMDQRFVLDDSTRVSAVVQKLSKAVGQPMQVTAFVRLAVGEGLEPATKPDFATEVASLTKQ